MYLNLHNFLERSTENGPGTRAVIWVQGCTRQCPGCFNPETHDLGIRHLIEVDALAARILALSDIEGITFSGGEPFLQAAALAELGRIAQQAGLGVVVFTGFTLDELTQADSPDWYSLLAVTDLLIAGPFRSDLICNLALRGSRNQTLHFLSHRYQALQSSLEQETNSVEILIDSSGKVTVTGFPQQGFLG